MKKLCLLPALVVLLVLAFPFPVMADEPAKYNFASAQGEKELKISPGNMGTGVLYFYNIDGNRITHISLTVSEAPEGWDVTIEPPLGETRVEVSGTPVTVMENLYVEPSELLSEEPKSVPEGMVSIKIPGRGYAQGKMAKVLINVPESASLGSTGEITIAAEAAWLGQGGSAAIKQARDFNFNVTLVSGQTEFSEKVIGTGSETAAIPETTGTQTYGAASPSGEQSGSFSLSKWLPAIIAGAVVILGVIFVVLFVRRRG
jgi:hypothetical protein